LDTRGKNFVDLAKSIYSLANTSSAVPSFSTNLTKALFITIREQALLFLAGVWTDSLIADIGALVLPQAALFHATAFLKAQIADTAQPHDFQIILPALLLALRAQQPAVRATAFECVSIIAESTRAAVPTSVYALDSVYGKSNGMSYTWENHTFFLTLTFFRRTAVSRMGRSKTVFNVAWCMW
jgi:U3 small nucleolar RNA-associated protein 10